MKSIKIVTYKVNFLIWNSQILMVMELQTYIIKKQMAHIMSCLEMVMAPSKIWMSLLNIGVHKLNSIILDALKIWMKLNVFSKNKILEII